MKKKPVLLLAALTLALTFSAQAAQAEMAYIVHGIPGSKFDLDLEATGRGEGRLIAHHTAKAPTVDVDIWRGQRVRNVIEVEDFKPGEQVQADLRSGNWRTRLRVADTSTVAFGPTKFQVRPYRATVVFAVGTALTDSFDLVGFRANTAFR